MKYCMFYLIIWTHFCWWVWYFGLITICRPLNWGVGFYFHWFSFFSSSFLLSLSTRVRLEVKGRRRQSFWAGRWDGIRLACWGRQEQKKNREKRREGGGSGKGEEEKSSRKNRGARLSGPGMISAYFRIFSFYYSTLIVAVLSLSLFVDWSRCRKPFISSCEAQSLLALFFYFHFGFFWVQWKKHPGCSVLPCYLSYQGHSPASLRFHMLWSMDVTNRSQSVSYSGVRTMHATATPSLPLFLSLAMHTLLSLALLITSLTLRGNAVHSNLYRTPTYFQAVTHLDFKLIFFAMPFRWWPSLTVHARTPATLQHQAPQWLNLTHSSHFVHQTVTPGDEACHSSPLPPSSSSRSPSSAGDGCETSSAGHGSGGTSASRSSSPHLYSFIPSWPSSTWRPYPPAGLPSVGHPFCSFKNKVAAPLDLHGGCLAGGLPKPRLYVKISSHGP